MALKFGLALMNDFPPDVSPSTRVGALREQAGAAAVSGVESVWVLQHYLGSMPTLQPLHLLAALAADTGEMSVGTNMYILPLRHPVGAAEEFSTLDHLTGGRVIAGLGMGYRENEFEAFGIPMTERLGRFTESVEIMRRLWSGERVSYSGRYFSIDDEKISLPPVQPGGPQIWIGAGGLPKAIDRAARLGDAWIIPPHVTGDRLVEALSLYLDARERHGRTGRPELVVRREILLDEDRDRAWQLGSAARAALTRMYSAYNPPDRSVDYRHLSSADEAAKRAKEVYLFTDPEGAVEELSALQAAGITKVVLRMQWFDLPQDRMLHSLELFRQRVLPAFR